MNLALVGVTILAVFRFVGERRHAIPPAIPVAIAVELKRELALDARLLILIRADDALHQVVAHYVSLVEITERQTFHILQDIRRFHQTAALRLRQVNLRYVAGDYGLGV